MVISSQEAQRQYLKWHLLSKPQNTHSLLDEETTEPSCGETNPMPLHTISNPGQHIKKDYLHVPIWVQVVNVRLQNTPPHIATKQHFYKANFGLALCNHWIGATLLSAFQAILNTQLLIQVYSEAHNDTYPFSLSLSLSASLSPSFPPSLSLSLYLSLSLMHVYTCMPPVPMKVQNVP